MQRLERLSRGLLNLKILKKATLISKFSSHDEISGKSCSVVCSLAVAYIPINEVDMTFSIRVTNCILYG